MFLIVGLGNPGKKYLFSRHNLGFLTVDKIISDYNFPKFREKFLGLYSNKIIDDIDVKIIKPLTFMNNSGNSIELIKKFYKIKIENIIVIQDDLDMNFCKLRIKLTGRDGGHNGIKSIASKIGNDFCRIKIGINKANQNNTDSKNFVLENFNNEEKLKLDYLIKKISQNLHLVLMKEYNKFTTLINV